MFSIVLPVLRWYSSLHLRRPNGSGLTKRVTRSSLYLLSFGSLHAPPALARLFLWKGLPQYLAWQWPVVSLPTFQHIRPKEYFSPDRREHDSNLFPTTLTQEKALRTREVKTALKQFTTMEFSVTTVGPAYRYTLYPLPGWASY